MIHELLSRDIPILTEQWLSLHSWKKFRLVLGCRLDSASYPVHSFYRQHFSGEQYVRKVWLWEMYNSFSAVCG